MQENRVRVRGMAVRKPIKVAGNGKRAAAAVKAATKSSEAGSDSSSSSGSDSDAPQPKKAKKKAEAAHSMHRDGTHASHSAAELAISAQLAKDPWGR